MLVTTCPECETTFRVTEAILAKASGRVRCGRCAHIFDANNALREHEDSATRTISGLQETAGKDGPVAKLGETSGITRSWILQDVAADDAAATGSEPDEAEAIAETEATAEPVVLSATDVPGEAGMPGDAEALAGPETLAEPEAPNGTEAPTATNTEVDAATAWLPPLDEVTPRRHGLWLTGTVLLAVALAVQLIHHFRGELADAPVIGTAVQGTYAVLGIPASRQVDLGQYATIDLTAVAEPVSGEQGWLVIETRIQNRGPKEQPYPYIFVSLLDRWEEQIAGRYFAPDEYVVSAASDYSRMRIGASIDVQFIIADPGPSATGFALEFCTPKSEGFLCENDVALN